MKKYTIAILCTIAFISSCETSPSSNELLASKKSEAEAKFKQIYACYDKAISTPKTTKDYVKWDSDAPPSASYGSSNVYQIGIESFKDLSEPLDILLDGTRRREHADMAKLFKIDLSAHKLPHNYPINAKYSFSESSDEPNDYCSASIYHFLNSRYLLINRIDDVKHAFQIDDETYSEGTGSGDVLIFDLETANLIGGFVIKTESSSYMTLSEHSNVYNNLEADLALKIQEAIKVKYRKLTEGIGNNDGVDF